MGHRRKCLLVILAVIVGGSQVFGQDPCDAYTVLSVDSKRLPTNSANDNICDVNVNQGWYRLVGSAGSDLHNATVPTSRCGTSSPLWMSGSIPTTSAGIVDRSVCVSSVFSTCQSSFTIQVKNCCSYRVYNLEPAGSCPSAYCISQYTDSEVCADNTTTTAQTTMTSTTEAETTTTEPSTSTTQTFMTSTTEAETTTTEPSTSTTQTTMTSTTAAVTTTTEPSTSTTQTTMTTTTAAATTTTEPSTSTTQTTMTTTTVAKATTTPKDIAIISSSKSISKMPYYCMNSHVPGAPCIVDWVVIRSRNVIHRHKAIPLWRQTGPGNTRLCQSGGSSYTERTAHFCLRTMAVRKEIR